MTILSFAPFRFTPADVAAFDALALPKLERGLWSAVTRQTGKSFDRMFIHFPGLEAPVFSFERDKHGEYHLWYHDHGSLHEIGEGETAEACLSVWKPRSRTSNNDSARSA